MQTHTSGRAEVRADETKKKNSQFLAMTNGEEFQNTKTKPKKGKKKTKKQKNKAAALCVCVYVRTYVRVF